MLEESLVTGHSGKVPLSALGAATLRLVQTTVSANTSDTAGAIHVVSGTEVAVEMLGSTIAGNTGSTADALSMSGGTLDVVSSVVGGASGTADCALGSGVLAANVLGHYEDASCDGTADGDAVLDALADNGGSVQTMLPGAASLLLDAGTCEGTDYGFSADLTEDARGEARPTDLTDYAAADDGCDIGAVEATEADDVGFSRHYVTTTGSGRGTSWSDATSLQGALIRASDGDEVWVAAGTYLPTTDGDRSVSFEISSGVAVYGGFTGSETSLPERQWATNVTTLSGDIGTPGNASDNSRSVVYGVDLSASTVLDGFTITGGNGGRDAQYTNAIGCAQGTKTARTVRTSASASVSAVA